MIRCLLFVLLQSAHMAVIEAMMQLFIKEQVAVDRVLNTVKRFSAPVSTSEAPTDPDSALLLWTKRCCESLKLKIESEEEVSETPLRKFSNLWFFFNPCLNYCAFDSFIRAT